MSIILSHNFHYLEFYVFLFWLLRNYEDDRGCAYGVGCDGVLNVELWWLPEVHWQPTVQWWQQVTGTAAHRVQPMEGRYNRIG